MDLHNSLHMHAPKVTKLQWDNISCYLFLLKVTLLYCAEIEYSLENRIFVTDKAFAMRGWHQTYSGFIGSCKIAKAEKFTGSLLDKMKILAIQSFYHR
jgi:hypothetical protein